MFEKKRGKRFLASVMALVMLLSLAPVGALATEDGGQPAENQPVAQPADETNPKPTVTGGEDTTNTNEEPTPPPSNEGDAGTPADNNDTSTAVSEMPVIMNPVDLLNQVSDYAERKRPQSNIQDATFFYLKTPASNPYSNTVGDWGKTMGDGNGKINISNLNWTETNAPGQGHTVQNAFNVTNDTVTSWPSGSGSYDNKIGGYVLNRESKHWKTIFSAYKESIKKQLSIADVQESDVQYIILKPFKVSRYNITNGSYHVDCQVEVKGYKFATATFNLWDDEADAYKFYSAKDYKVGSPVEFPREMNKPGYTFSGWYLNEELTGSALDEYTIEKNVTFYAKYTPNTYTVTFDSQGGSDVASQEVNHGATATTPTEPTKAGFEFKGWCTSATCETAYDFATAVTEDITLYAKWEAQKHTVTFDSQGGSDVASQEVNHGATATTPTEPTKAGFEFKGWCTSATCETAYDFATAVTEDITLYAKWDRTEPIKPTEIKYTINQHFMKAKGSEQTDLARSNKDQSANENAVLNELITNLVKDQKIGNDKYMYVSGKYTTKSESQKDQPITSESKLTEDTTIDLYYYLDNWKDADNTTDKDSETGGDGIPDCNQVLIKYVSSNSDRGTVSPDMEVLTIRKANGKVEPMANGSTATDKGGRNYFSNWTDKDNTQVSTNATLNNGAIQNVIKEFKGGETYTFTANFGYSSGGGSGGSNRPKPPVVDIPDDVPTGLNGKDHYAYIIGYGNNDVRPQNNITRAEVATIFFRLLTDETRTANMTKSNGYNDVKDGDWFCCAVSTLSKMGIIKGYEDGSFKPNDPISRAEFAAIAARFDPDGDKTPATFADVTSHWAKDEISIAANHGWIKGYEDGSFKPDQKITRAETMTLVNRVLNRLPEAKDDLHKDMKTWVDNMDETAWYYLAVQEATNSHYFKNKTGTKFEQWTDLRDTRDWSELEK